MKKGETFDIDPNPLLLLFFNNLSEKDRRYFCGLEAIRLGVHGVTHVSSFFLTQFEPVRQSCFQATYCHPIRFVDREVDVKKNTCYSESYQRSDGHFTGIYSG